MSKELSALFDGELEVHENPVVWDDLRRNPRLRETWQNYKLIGDALRAEGNLACDITSGVMRGLASEPAILAPQPRRVRKWSSVILAMAASVAGVAVVGWLALSQAVPGGGSAMLAKQATGGPSGTTVVAAPAPAPSHGMQEYMLAHQANAPGLNLQGGTQHIRTVSVVGTDK